MNIQIQYHKKGFFIFHLKPLKKAFKDFFKKKLIHFPIHQLIIYQDKENYNQLKIYIEMDSILTEYFYNIIASKIFKKLKINYLILEHSQKNIELLEDKKLAYFFYSEMEIFQFYCSIIIDQRNRLQIHLKS